MFDVDWLLDPFGRQAGDGPVDWTALRDGWLHVAHGVAQGGLPTMLLGPLLPEHLEPLPGRAWVGAIHYLVLDCPDDERRRRLAARPAWRRRADVEGQVAFGRWLRANLSPVLDTGSGPPAAVADRVVAWFRREQS